MSYYFSKEYLEEPFISFMKEIGKIEYYKCVKCGFVFSKTHSELSHKVWEKLNNDWHHYEEFEKTKRYNNIKSHTALPFHSSTGNPPPYLEQVTMLNVLYINGIIDLSDILDFAGGYGTASKILQKYFNFEMKVYDPYVHDNIIDYTNYYRGDKHKSVFNSAMFEHITKRDDLEILNDLVDDDGCLILHTVICERIPDDPDWFYFGVVHCAFHTNKSMEILMQQWNYSCSIYCPKSKCWVLFKKESDLRLEKINLINMELQNNYLYYKKGFLDYWKGF